MLDIQIIGFWFAVYWVLLFTKSYTYIVDSDLCVKSGDVNMEALFTMLNSPFHVIGQLIFLKFRMSEVIDLVILC